MRIFEDEYHYGNNGKYKDNEWAGVGNRLDFGARGLGTRIGRWESVDELFKKYPSVSPYAFVNNSPIVHFDPDRKRIWIASEIKNANGSTTIQRVQYKGGKLYGENGKPYTGNNSYVTKVQKDLNRLNSDNKDLAKREHTLELSKNDHTIQMPPVGHPMNGNSPLSPSDDKKHIPTGTTTYYDPDNRKTNAGEERKPVVGLAHELLGHGWDSDQGKTDRGTTKGVPNYEINAVNVENKARAAEGEPKKTTYGGEPIPDKPSTGQSTGQSGTTDQKK